MVERVEAGSRDEGVGLSLAQAFAREARRGVRLAVYGRAVAFALLWIDYYDDAQGFLANPYFRYRSALVAAALLGGVAAAFASHRSRRPLAWCGAFLVLDLAIITLLVFGWLPPAIADYPQFIAVRMQDVLLFVVILAASALPLSPRLVAAAGAGAVVLWVGAVAHAFMTTPERSTRTWPCVAPRAGTTSWPASAGPRC